MTIVAASHMTIEAIRAATALMGEGIHAEVVDLRSVRPLDHETILRSVKKTHRLIVADTGWKSFGIGAEIVAMVAESGIRLATPPLRIALPDLPAPQVTRLPARTIRRALICSGSALVLVGKTILCQSCNHALHRFRHRCPGLYPRPARPHIHRPI